MLDMFTDKFYSNAFFDVNLAGPGALLTGRFTSVSGLGMEVEYEVYNEGGSLYPYFFFKEAKPQVLVLEQGIITDVDAASILMGLVNSGISVPMGGVITMKDNLGTPLRAWTILGAHLQKYMGPDFNSNQPALAVTRMEFLYNGCL